MQSKKALIPILLIVLALGGWIGYARNRATANQLEGRNAQLPMLLWKLPHASWAPPAGSLPKDYVEDANKLLAAGFGDPRGGEYRVLYSGLTIYHEVFSPNYDAPPKLVLKETRGWYFPPRDGIPAHAVLVDGFTCEPAKVGPRADLDHDIKAAIDIKTGRSWIEQFDPNEFKESDGVLLLCLIGRIQDAKKLGEIDLKLRKLEANAFKDPHNPVSNLKALDADEALSKFVQTVGFYGGRSYIDGQLSLSYQAITLERNLQKTYLTELFPSEKKYPRAADEDAKLARTIADIERRLKDPEVALDEETLAKKNKADRIRYLIGNLDQIAVQRSGFHGGNDVEFINTPQDRALIAEGPEAVGPLLDCIQNNDDLTRSYSFRGHAEVREAALAAFRGILKLDYVLPGFKPYGGEPPKWDAQHNVPYLTQMWSQLGGLTPDERYFQILNDDNADSMMWYEAAVRLMCPQDVDLVSTHGSGRDLTDFESTPSKPYTFELPAHKGSYDEPLSPVVAKYRSAANPSLTELLTKRVNQMVAANQSDQSPSMDNARHAMTLARYLAAWDPKSAPPVLRAAFAHFVELVKNHGFVWQAQEEPIWNFRWRLKLGDDEAWQDYIDALNALGHSQDVDYQAWIAPIVEDKGQHHGDSVLDRLFNDQSSSWNPSNHGGEGVISPLLIVPQFQKAVLQSLDDTKRLGSVRADGTWEDMDNGSSSSITLEYPLVKGETRTIRVCDHVARELSFALAGAPSFSQEWPQAKKDAALIKMKQFMKENAANMANILPKFDDDGWSRHL